MLYEEIDASSLIKVDHDGNTIFNASDYGVNAAGFVIHSAIHMAKYDVDCVAHTHTPAGMAVSAMECGLLPLAQTSMRFVHIAYHDFEGIADDVGERERLVADLGDHEAMILRNHGLLVVGRTIPAAFNALFRLERACEVEFFISYEFRSRMLGVLMGSMFDVAFRRFTAAFERRADAIYRR